MVFTLMQKSSFIGTSLVTKEAQQARPAKVSALPACIFYRVLRPIVDVVPSKYCLPYRWCRASVPDRHQLIVRLRPADGLCAGSASQRQAQRHSGQEGRQDRQEDCQARRRQSQVNSQTEQEQGRDKVWRQQLVRPRQAKVPRYVCSALAECSKAQFCLCGFLPVPVWAVCCRVLTPGLCLQAPSLHLPHTFLESLLETMDGTQLVCQQTPPHLSDTGTLRSFMLDGPCWVLLVRSTACHSVWR